MLGRSAEIQACDQDMKKEQIADALRLFNEKTERLGTSNFVKEAETKSGFSIQASVGKPVEVTRFGPGQQEMDAFVLSLRFLIQDNEASSFRNLAKVYKSPAISEENQIKFRSARHALNTYLESSTMFRMNDKTLTREELMHVFVYGGLAHANKRKKERYDRWMADGLLAPLLTNEFIVTVFEVLNVALFVKRVNEGVLQKLKEP